MLVCSSPDNCEYGVVGREKDTESEIPTPVSHRSVSRLKHVTWGFTAPRASTNSAPCDQALAPGAGGRGVCSRMAEE